MPIDDLYARINIVNGVLSLAPLKFGVAGGRLSADINMDGKRNPAAVKMKISARGLKLNQLFPSIQSMKASIGVLAGDAQLSASGNSIAAILATSNGEVKALISEGTVSKFLLEAAGLNIGSVVVTKLFGDKQVPLNCMAADFGVNDGLMKTRTFVVDTKDATILVDGDINFATEKLDLTIHPESKGLRVFSLRSPLYVKGTFKNPDTGVDKGKVALKAGAAALLGTVAAPAAALLALINPGGEKDSPCARLLATASEKPVAPAPPKGVPTVTHQADDRPANGAH